MTSPDPRVPTPVRGVDARRLTITPAEAFVLGLVDGRATIEELADLSGLAREVLVTALARLAAAGAIELPRPPPRASQTFASPAATTDAELLAAASELSPDLRRRVVELRRRVEHGDHYAALGVERTADRRDVRRAYGDLVGWVHPDRHFGVDLGPFRPVLDALFARLTEAHDVLASATRRAAYDATLPPAAAAPAPPPAPAAPTPPAPAPRTPPPAPPPSAVAAAPPARPPAPRASPAPLATPSAVVPPTPEAERERREALARKLLGNRVPARATSSSAPPAGAAPPAPTTAVADGSAAALESEGARAAAAGRVADALRLYGVAARQRPTDGPLHHRAAAELERAAPREALAFARRAAELEPDDGATRLLLARLYHAAGLVPAARAELRAALRLVPESPEAIALGRRLGA